MFQYEYLFINTYNNYVFTNTLYYLSFITGHCNVLFVWKNTLFPEYVTYNLITNYVVACNCYLCNIY